MNNREPPKMAVWLLRRWASPYQRDSLLGDLLEMYRAGRSRLWYWRQVIAALILARARALRSLPGTSFGDCAVAARKRAAFGWNHRLRGGISYRGGHNSNR
jgi:hypothetical protein